MRIFLKILCVVGIVVLTAAAVVGCNIVQNQSFTTTFYDVSTDKNINNLRLVVLSDLHNHQFGKDNQKLVEKINALSPNVIMIVGDMVNYYDPDHSVMLSLVKQLSEIAPVYYSAGNHEVETVLRNEGSTIREDINAAGGIYLSHKYVEVRVGSNKFLVAGACKNAKDILEYERSMLEDFTKQKGFKILLNHFPEIFESQMEDYPVDLALCGHAHGGWIRLPFGDGLFAPDQGLFPKYTSGIRELCSSTVIISRGLWTSHNSEIRINNKPELVVVDIN